MLEQGPELLIMGVTRQDIGLYYCVAENLKGLLNMSLELDVYCKFDI